MNTAVKLVKVSLTVLSLIINWILVNLPLSEFGLTGRQAIIFGKVTLLQTFLYPHPYLIPWAAGFVLQMLSLPLIILSVGRKLQTIITFSAGMSTIALWFLIMERWSYSGSVTPMYVLGLPASLIPFTLGLLGILESFAKKRAFYGA